MVIVWAQEPWFQSSNLEFKALLSVTFPQTQIDFQCITIVKKT
ncbi:hypothetical protein yrohd0001_30660 [Yersinia rohdei ATCC 43380]|nr:hypothetical protein yrohd0001_30660 [Yersinia rohdei ATCC 43380]